MTKIAFDRGIPREIRVTLAPFLKQHARLLPSWCHRLHVGWDASGESFTRCALAYMSSDVEYRMARVAVCPRWLELSESRREETVVHELAHVVLAPLQDLAQQLSSHLAPEDGGTEAGFAAWVREEVRKAVEGTTCDITAAWLHGR